MKLINGNINSLLDAIKDKRLIACGESGTSAMYLEAICDAYPVLYDRIDCVVWNKGGDTFPLGSKKIEKPCFTFEYFLQNRPYGADYAMLFAEAITMHNFFDKFRLPEGVIFFVAEMLLRNTDYDLDARTKEAEPLIPKLLHYIWFGGNEMRPIHHKCMESWRKFCPDYEIIRWDENNYDVTKHPYLHAAYKQKEWAFVCDYARLDILYHYGGIYLDTDVEVIKPLDGFLYDTGFCAMEHPWLVNSGLIMGAAGEHPMIKIFRDRYDDVRFINPDGTKNRTTITTLLSRVLHNFGFKNSYRIQQIHGLTIYPMDVFAPMPPQLGYSIITERTHTMHHYDSSWHPPGMIRYKYSDANKCRELLQKYCDEKPEFVPMPPMPDSLIQQMPPEMWRVMPEAADAIYSGNFEKAMTFLDEYLSESLERGSAEDAEYILAAQLFAAALLGDSSLTRDVRTIRLELFTQTGQQEKAAREYSLLEKLCTDEEMEVVREMAGVTPPTPTALTFSAQ